MDKHEQDRGERLLGYVAAAAIEYGREKAPATEARERLLQALIAWASYEAAPAQPIAGTRPAEATRLEDYFVADMELTNTPRGAWGPLWAAYILGAGSALEISSEAASDGEAQEALLGMVEASGRPAPNWSTPDDDGDLEEALKKAGAMTAEELALLLNGT